MNQALGTCVAAVFLTVLATQARAMNSIVSFSSDGFFPEFADPASLPATAYPVEEFYSEANYGARLSQTSVGWTFTLRESAPLEGLGVYDYGADGLLVDHLIGLWRLPSGLDDLSDAELIAVSLIENGDQTLMDGPWRYSTDMRAPGPFSYRNEFSDSQIELLSSLRDSDPDAYWSYFRSSTQTIAPWPEPLAEIDLEPGEYAILSNQIASRSNRDAEVFEDARKIDFLHFVEPEERYPIFDERVDLRFTGGPIGPGAYYSYTTGDPHEFWPTNVQLFPGMMVGPTLFLGVPEPTTCLLAAITLIALVPGGRRLPTRQPGN